MYLSLPWCFFGGKVKNVIFALEKDKQAERFQLNA